ncbi:MAG: hypothetical protein ABR538_02040 [Candidatus Binatia bacterium]
MRDLPRNALRLAAGAALLAALLVAAHTTASDPRQGAILRVTLRTTAGTAQDCRRLSQEELEALPVHMRRPEVCETRAVPYHLDVRINDRPMLDRTYTASGIHGDRPLVVDEEIALAAGSHHVVIRFTPVIEAGAGPDDGTPPSFTFDGPASLVDGRIRVATLDPTSTRFEIR